MIASLKNLCTRRSFTAALAQFHSTPISLGKWRNKWDRKDGKRQHEMQSKGGKGQHEFQSKSYAKYEARRKRAESKKALKDVFVRGKVPHWHALDEFMKNFGSSNDVPRFKYSNKEGRAYYQSQHGHQHGRRSRHYKGRGFRVDDFVHGDDTFASMFGDDGEFRWSNTSSGDSSHNRSKFKSKGESRRAKAQETSSSDSEEEIAPSAESHSHRVVLGLPLSGPLELSDVKLAFRASALKWHPDKHPVSSQAAAEEKFKRCADAYDALCSSLKPG